MRRLSSALTASAYPRLGLIPNAVNTSIASRSKARGGEFVQLTPTVAEYIACAIEAGRHASAGERRKAIEERERRSERDYDNWAWDVLDSGCPAFHGLPFVSCL